jgi:hypothetical protein
MESTVVYLKDRCLLSDVPKAVASKLSSARLLTTSGKKVCYCGLITVGNLTCVFLPRQTETSCSVSVKRNFSPALFKALRLYSQQSDRLNTSDDEGENLEGSEQLSLAYDLLSDYRMNGLYSRRDIHRKTNEGKPNWPRTVAKHQPYLSPSGPIYMDYEGSKSRNRTDSEASRIHAYLIQNLDVTYGEAFFGNTSFRDGGLTKPSTISKRYFLAILNGELQKLYSERDMKIFRMLIKLVEKVWGNTTTSRFIGTKSFHTIWEHMLKKVISGTINLNDKFSIPTYTDAQGKRYPAAQKGQRTDIIIHKEESNTFAIIDAKYYEATSLTTSPGWPDLVKQFFYAKAVESLYANATIKNFFIFPGTESHFQSVLMADRKDESKTDEQYKEIECVYIDPSEVIEAYVTGGVLTDLSERLTT